MIEIRKVENDRAFMGMLLDHYLDKSLRYFNDLDDAFRIHDEVVDYLKCKDLPEHPFPGFEQLLKDEEFLHRLIATSNLSPQETLRIENMIFTGATPTVQFGPSPWNKNEIIDWIGQKVRKNFNSYYMYKQYPDTEEGAKEFNVAMNLIQKEFMRIGYIYVDVLGEDRGVQAFENLIGEVQASQPIASLELDDPNPLPQNKQTRPEEIVPGAAGFNDALVRLEKFGMSRRDLSLSNYMMRKDGHIVIADPGAFKMKRV